MIPKIFHQVWINNDNPELPEDFVKYRDAWLDFHPGWEYRLWNMSNLDFDLIRPDLIAQAANYAQMADILRYQILYIHGGIYIDTDFECLRSIESILNGVDNFACSEDGKSITNAIIGATPRSAYMKRCIDLIPEKIGISSAAEETGPSLLTRALLSGGIAGDFHIFPKIWFYPYSYDEPERANDDFSESYAVHRWAYSWGKSDKKIRSRIRKKIKKFMNGIGL